MLNRCVPLLLSMDLAAAAGALDPQPPARCALPGTACRPDGPWPQLKCTALTGLANKSACKAARGTPTCNAEGCTTALRCTWNATSTNCTDPPPPPPPQPCAQITTASECAWSASGARGDLGRDCRWKGGACAAVAPATSVALPTCAADHSCARNGKSATPPMGWRSWNLFAGKNSDITMRDMMHAFTDKSRSVGGVPTSLAEVGYVSVGMDDGFQLCNCSGGHGEEDIFPHSLYNVSCSGMQNGKPNQGEGANACRDGRCTWHNQSDGTPMIDKLKFPDLKGLVAYGHSLALQVGFYLNNCICMEKGRTYFQQDVAFMADVGFDTVKIDQCGSAMNMSLWAALINATGKPMMLENCHNAPSWWSPGADAATTCDSNMWRSGGDIGNGFGGALSEAHQWFGKNNLSSLHKWGAAPISRPGCWGYPDMMEIGNFCKDGAGENPLCEREERAHMGLWCMMSSPLVLGFNMSSKADMDRVWPTITNREAIAVDHAWVGSPGMLFKTLSSKENATDASVEVWAKPLPGQSVAVLVLNTGTANITVDVSLKADVPGQPKAPSYRSIWEHKDVAVAGGAMALSLSAHGSVFAVLNQTSVLWT